jgi:hypothetical protein
VEDVAAGQAGEVAIRHRKPSEARCIFIDPVA